MDILPPVMEEDAQYWGERLYRFSSVDSTSRIARDYARAGEGDGTLFIAGEQTQGEGRLKRAWHSPPGGLWMSLILRPRKEVSRFSGISLLFSLWILQYLEPLLGKPLLLYWPNDVYLEEKKLCGVLMESTQKGGILDWLVAGIGINVNNSLKDLPPGVKATSLCEHTGSPVPLEPFTRALLSHVEKCYYSFMAEGFPPYLPAMASRSPMPGRMLEIEDHRGIRAVRCLGFGQSGELIIENEAGDEEYLWSAERVRLL